MSRIDELKKQNSFLNINGVEIIGSLFDKTKYVEMLINLIKNDRIEGYNSHRKEYEYEVLEYGIDKDSIDKMTSSELLFMSSFLNHFVGFNNFKLFKEFIDLNERNLIPQNDVTKYKMFREIELQISLSELNNMDKELSKQVIELYEDDQWLVVKPMSYQSSLKYGASTKWCTTSRENPEYYLKYSRQGILIYCINKITGDKVAAFKRIDKYERETSFWNIVDERIDSMDSGLPIDVMNVIRKEFEEQTMSNFTLLSDEERNRQLIELEGGGFREEMNMEVALQNEVPRLRNRFRNVGRIIPFRNDNIDNNNLEDIDL